MDSNSIRRIISSYWLGQDTFVVEFDREFTTIKPFDKGDINIIMVEYHKDENKWVIYKEYYNSDEEYIEQSNDGFTSYERVQYITMAQMEYNRVCCGISWFEIVVSDNYEKYDTFVDSIKNYYVNNDNAKANEVEDICNKHIIEMLNELNIKFK